MGMRGREPILRSDHAPASLPQPQSREEAVRMRGDFRESFLFAAPVDCVLVGRSIAAEQHEIRTLAAPRSVSAFGLGAISRLRSWALRS